MVTIEVDVSDGEDEFSEDCVGFYLLLDVVDQSRKDEVHSLDVSYLLILLRVAHQDVGHLVFILLILEG